MTNPSARSPVDDRLAIATERTTEQSPDCGREPVGQSVDGAEVEHTEAAVGEHAVVTRVRVGMEQPGPDGPGKQEPHVQQANAVAFLAAAVAQDRRERCAGHPFAHEHSIRAGENVGHEDVGVIGVCLREGVLRGRLEPVVELFCNAFAQFLQQRLDIEPGRQHAEQASHAAELTEVGQQRLARARDTAP